MDDRIRRSRSQEQRVAKSFKGRRTPGSGNQWHTKNDVRTDTHSFELKTTKAKQYILKAADLEAGERNALLDGRVFVFGIEMMGRNWIVLAEEDFELLLSEAGGLGGTDDD